MRWSKRLPWLDYNYDLDALLLRRRSVVRVQHPVGQGFFHSGHLRTPWHTLNWVYDCGSIGKQQPLRRALNSYVGHLDTQVDLLVLSHFHADHVRGVMQLLNHDRRPHVTTVMLPFIGAKELALAYSGMVARDPRLRSESLLSKFMEHPVRVLRDFGVDTVILVDPDEGEADLPIDATNPRPDDGLPLDVGGALDGSLQVVGGRLKDDDGVRVVHLRPGGDVRLSEDQTVVWRFLPHVEPFDGLRMSDFYAAVNAIDGALPATEPDRSDHLRGLLLTHPAELRSVYRRLAPDANLSTLSLYAGPPTPHGVFSGHRHFGLDEEQDAQGDVLGWLAGGDARLGVPAVYARFRERFESVLPLVSTWCPPHHGADSDNDNDLLLQFRPAAAVVGVQIPRYRPTWVHPGPMVQAKMADAGVALWSVSSDASSRLVEHYMF